jgi:CHAT domain-containing protein/tetratricopeptide (TPR) repeat protein
MLPFGDEQEALLPAVHALLGSAGSAELAEVLTFYPELLDPMADMVIFQFVATASMEDEDQLAAVFGRRLRLVRQARKAGTEAALADLRSTVTADQPADLRSLWDTAVAAGAHDTGPADDACTAWSALVAHPGLAHADVDFQVLVLEAAIGSHKRAVESAPPGSEELMADLTALGQLHRSRYALTQRGSDLDSGIDAYSGAVAAAPPEHPTLPWLLNELGGGLRTRYGRDRQPPDLNATIDTYRRASELAPPGSSLLAETLNAGGLALIARNKLGARPEDVDEAIDDFTRAVEASAAGSPLLPDALNHLSGGHWTRYLQQGRTGDLEASVRAGVRSVQLTPADSGLLAGRLGNLAKSQTERYRTTQQSEALDAAIEAGQRWADVMPSESPELAQCLGGLGLALRARHERTGDLGDLEAAITAFRRALDTAGSGTPDMAGHFLNLGTGLARRYQVGNKITDLDEAIEVSRRAARESHAGTPIWTKSLSNLGGVLGLRYDRTGTPSDLDEAVQSLTEAAKAPADAPELPGVLNNLGGALKRLHYRDGRLADLERATEAQARAVELTPANSPDLAGYLYGLGSARLIHYRRTQALADLDAGIRDYQHAIETETDSLGQASVLSDLGDALLTRYPHSSNVEDLDAAIDSLVRAVDATPAHAASLARHLFQLGGGLAVRFAYGDDIADLDAAIDAFRRALALASRSDVLRANLLMALGGALLSRHDTSGRSDDLEAAVEALREGCAAGATTASAAVLNGAQLWGASAATRQAWPEAAEAYRYALEAAGRLVELEVGRERKESWLRAARELPGPAAHALARSGDIEAAVLVLERWRAIQLSGALHLDRRDVDRLRAAHPDLYERHQVIAGALQEAARRELADPGGGPPGETPELAATSGDLTRTLAEIRELPGFGDFLLPPDFAEVVGIVGDVPLAYLAAAPPGGLALLLRPGGEVTPVWLPELTDEELARRAWACFRVQGLPGWADEIDSLTQWLWSAVMSPLLAAAADAAAMILAPGGLLGFLPLHAAWTHDPSAITGRRYALDQTRLTYTGNARILAACRAAATGIETRSVLAVGDPADLAHAAGELDAVCAQFAAATRLEGATKDDVLAALGDHSVLHFACHGAASPADPLASSLRVAPQEQLTMRQVLTRRLTAARLAVLSACETAVPGAELPDEGVGMPSSFIEAGAAGAIGSLWEVPDVSTMMLMTRFYELWRESDQEPAEALRQAQQWLRDSTNEAKLRRFPDLPELAAGALPDWAFASWKEGHDHASPLHWAAFTYVGA